MLLFLNCIDISEVFQGYLAEQAKEKKISKSVSSYTIFSPLTAIICYTSNFGFSKESLETETVSWTSGDFYLFLKCVSGILSRV